MEIRKRQYSLNADLHGHPQKLHSPRNKTTWSRTAGSKRVVGGFPGTEMNQMYYSQRMAEEKEAETLDSPEARCRNQLDCRVTALAFVRPSNNLPGFTTFRFEIRMDSNNLNGSGRQIWCIYRRHRAFNSLLSRMKTIAPVFARKLAPFSRPDDPSATLNQLRQLAYELEAWFRHAINLWLLEPKSIGTSTKNGQNYKTLAGLMIAFLTEDWDMCPLGPQDAEMGLTDEMQVEKPTINVTDEPRAMLIKAFDVQYEDAKKNPLNVELLAVIGKGSFGKVFLANCKDNDQIVAIKVLDMAEMIRRKQSTRIEVERVCMTLCDSPFIVKLHSAVATHEHLYFVQDYCSGGEMYFHLDRKGKFSSKLARFYTAECAIALNHLHERNIVYRDLKPENIMICYDGHIKLVDFGLAKVGVSHAITGAKSFVGTMEYLSPEMANKSGHGFAVDYWSLGMVLYEMLTGLPPWYSEDRQVVLEHIQNSPLVFPPGEVSHNARDLLRKLLCKNPQDRMGSKHGFIELQQHPYFESLNFAKVSAKLIKPPYKPQIKSPEDVSYFDRAFTALPPVIDRMSKYPRHVDAKLVEIGEKEGLFDGFERVFP